MGPLGSSDLLHICRQKLYDHLSCSSDFDLRILVGHSNMMNSLIDSVNHQYQYPSSNRSNIPVYGSTCLDPIEEESESDSDSNSDVGSGAPSDMDLEDTLFPFQARVLTVRNPDLPSELDGDDDETSSDFRSVSILEPPNSGAEHTHADLLLSTSSSENTIPGNTDAYTSSPTVPPKRQAPTVGVQYGNSQQTKKKKPLPGKEGAIWWRGNTSIVTAQVIV
ncbi:hypothetical protein BDW75DRAFT_218672 [Aspergillus navahoensis]